MKRILLTPRGAMAAVNRLIAANPRIIHVRLGHPNLWVGVPIRVCRVSVGGVRHWMRKLTNHRRRVAAGYLWVVWDGTTELLWLLWLLLRLLLLRVISTVFAWLWLRRMN